MGRLTMAVFVPKKRLIFIGVALLSLVIGFLVFEYWLTYQYEKQVLASGANVILDPGHGGVDPGALTGQIKEKDIVLDVVIRMNNYLEEKGYSVQLTRDADIDLGGELTKGRHKRDLEARLNLINKGQVAISIHCNTMHDSSQKGAVVFYQKGSEEGKMLANAVLKEVNKVQLLNANLPLPRENLFLLKTAKIPVIIVELGFLSNQEDTNKLKDVGFRQQLAEAISKGIINYLQAGQQDSIKPDPQ